MCLPIKMVRYLVRINTKVNMLLGIIVMIGAIVQWQTTNGKHDAYFYDAGVFSRNLLLSFVFAFGIITFGLALAGWIGQRKKNIILITIFNLCNILIVMGLFVIGVTLTFYAQSFYNSSSSDNDETKQDTNVVELAKQQFCRVGCVCYIDLNKFPEEYFIDQGLIYTTDMQVSDIVNFKQCLSPEKLHSDDWIDLITTAEQEFECSGFYHPMRIFIFSDINRGPPRNTPCWLSVSEWAQSHGQSGMYLCLTSAFIILMLLLCACCLCFHPEKDVRASIFEKMAYYDD